MAARLRAARLASTFPGERTADLVVHVEDLRADEETRLGRPVTWEQALKLMVQRYRLQPAPRPAATTRSATLGASDLIAGDGVTDQSRRGQKNPLGRRHPLRREWRRSRNRAS